MTEASTENQATTNQTNEDILRARYGNTYDRLVELGHPENFVRVLADPQGVYGELFPTDEDKASVFNLAADMFETLGSVFQSPEFKERLGENLEERYGVLGKVLGKLMETVFGNVEQTVTAYREMAESYQQRDGEQQQEGEAAAAQPEDQRLTVADCPECVAPTAAATPATASPPLRGMTV